MLTNKSKLGMLPPSLVLDICMKARCEFTKITCSCRRYPLISTPLELSTYHADIPLCTKPLKWILQCKPSRTILNIRKRKGGQKTILQTKLKEENLIRSQGSCWSLKIKYFGTLECFHKHLFSLKQVSDLSLPPTHNLLHAVTLRGTLSSERREQDWKKQVQQEQAEKQYTETATCYVMLKATKSQLSSPAYKKVLIKSIPQETMKKRPL